MSSLQTRHLHRFFRQVSHNAPYALMLGGSAEASPLNQWVIWGINARQIITLEGTQLDWNGQTKDLSRANASPDRNEILFSALEQARQAAQRWPTEAAAQGLPFSGGLAGALGYGFYPWCDPGWQSVDSNFDADWPELLLCEFEDWLFINLNTGQLSVLCPEPSREARYYEQWQAITQGDSDSKSLSLSEPLSAPTNGCASEIRLAQTDALEAYLGTFEPSFSPERFEATVERLKECIRNGEIYQANLSIRLQKELRLDPYDLFERLCEQNPSPFSGFFKWPGGVIVSNSPERLVQSDVQGRVQSRPIAGTRGRGKDAEEDRQIGEILLGNEKELAEHRMLVDLARNDLGQVCEAGSVQVDDLLVLERYSHVTHLVSNVVGQLKPELGPWALLRSTFPGGTITGCPKVRCVELLQEAESVSRGFYTGSLGYLDAASPAMDWNILIRSVFLKETPALFRYNAAVHVGAGIVHDAVGAHEYRECLRKATASLKALRTVEQDVPELLNTRSQT